MNAAVVGCGGGGGMNAAFVDGEKPPNPVNTDEAGTLPLVTVPVD